MGLFNRKRAAAPPRNTSTPAQDIAALGPVVQQNHVAYVPSQPWALVPGVGTGNLAYVPDFLLSAPEWYAGNAVAVPANRFVTVKKPGMIVLPSVPTAGVGGVVAGQIALQQLLEVQVNMGDTTSE